MSAKSRTFATSIYALTRQMVESEVMKPELVMRAVLSGLADALVHLDTEAQLYEMTDYDLVETDAEGFLELHLKVTDRCPDKIAEATQSQGLIRAFNVKRSRSYPPIGSYSEGTMRMEDDVLPVVLDTLDDYLPGWREEHVDDSLEEILTADDWTEHQREVLTEWLAEELWNLMDTIAPPFTSWGSHEGDGACYGFWIHSDILNCPQYDEDNDLERVSDLSEVKLDREWVLVVNDHGNATLYRRSPGRSLDGDDSVYEDQFEMIWSVV